MPSERTPAFVERVAAPQQAGRPALRVPLVRRGRELLDERRVLLVLVEPAPQRRPARRPATRGRSRRSSRLPPSTLLHDEQARVDQLIDQALRPRRPRATARAARRASTIARVRSGVTSAQEDRARELLRGRGRARDDASAWRRERAADAAHRLVARVRQHAARRDRGPPTASPRRTAAAAARPACGRGVEHVVDDRRRLERDSRPSRPAATSASRRPARVGVPRNNRPRASSSMNSRILGDAIEKVRAHRHARRAAARRVVGDRRRARAVNAQPLVGVGHQRVQLLELIDEQQACCGLSRRARPRSTRPR